jgi:hypothetical protein
MHAPTHKDTYANTNIQRALTRSHKRNTDTFTLAYTLYANIHTNTRTYTIRILAHSHMKAKEQRIITCAVIQSHNQIATRCMSTRNYTSTVNHVHPHIYAHTHTCVNPSNTIACARLSTHAHDSSAR